MTSSQSSSGYGSQGFQPSAPSGPSQWGSRGSSSGHDYPHAPYPSQNQYPPSQYGGYPAQQAAPPRSSFGPGWGEQHSRPPPVMLGPSPHGGGGGYDYFGSHGYGQSHVSDHRQPAPYTTLGGVLPPPVLGYGQGGYSEAARYGVQNNSSYPQGGSYSGYPQDTYSKPLPSYGMQGHPYQFYGQGGPVTGQYSQPSYPYASDGNYSQQAPPSTAAGGYHHHHLPQQGNGKLPVSGYVQPGFGYGQVGPLAATASYGSGYADPSVHSSAVAAAASGYQAPAEQSAGYNAGSAYGNYGQTTVPPHKAYDH